MSYVGFYGSIVDEAEPLEDNHPEPLRDKHNTWNWWIGYHACVFDDNETLVLEHHKKGWQVQIRKDDFRPLGKPAYHIGDVVLAKSRGKQATIVGVTWHDKRGCFRYTLDYGDRVSTNWFFEDDLEMVEDKWKERFDG